MDISSESETVVESGSGQPEVVEVQKEPSKEDKMQDLLDRNFPAKPLRKSDIIDGKVIAKFDHEISIGIGYKSEGVVPVSEARSLGEEGFENLQEGQEVIVFVVTPEDKDGRPLLSIDRARGEQGWRYLEKAMDSKETVKGTIVGSNRGGAVVESEGVQGFVPVSQLVGRSRELYQANDEAPKEGFLGLEIEFKVVEINRRRNRAIFSQREAAQAWKKAQKARLVEELEEGIIRDGTVVGISNFGAFVDLGGADGLIHISELSWEPIKSPADVVSVGEKIKVYVLHIDKENLRIALSLRKLEPEPWLSVGDKFKVGDIISGRVTKVTAFGAFVRVDQGIEGLIHVSEMSNEMTEHPKDVVSEGQEVKVKVIRIDPEKRRMGLSIKQLQEEGERGSTFSESGATSASTDGGTIGDFAQTSAGKVEEQSEAATEADEASNTSDAKAGKAEEQSEAATEVDEASNTSDAKAGKAEEQSEAATEADEASNTSDAKAGKAEEQSEAATEADESPNTSDAKVESDKESS